MATEDLSYFKFGNNLIKRYNATGGYAYLNHSNNWKWENSWELTEQIETDIPAYEPVPITLEQAQALHLKLTGRELAE